MGAEGVPHAERAERRHERRRQFMTAACGRSHVASNSQSGDSLATRSAKTRPGRMECDAPYRVSYCKTVEKTNRVVDGTPGSGGDVTGARRITNRVAAWGHAFRAWFHMISRNRETITFAT